MGLFIGHRDHIASGGQAGNGQCPVALAGDGAAPVDAIAIGGPKTVHQETAGPVSFPLATDHFGLFGPDPDGTDIGYGIALIIKAALPVGDPEGITSQAQICKGTVGSIVMDTSGRGDDFIGIGAAATGNGQFHTGGGIDTVQGGNTEIQVPGLVQGVENNVGQGGDTAIGIPDHRGIASDPQVRKYIGAPKTGTNAVLVGGGSPGYAVYAYLPPKFIATTGQNIGIGSGHNGGRRANNGRLWAGFTAEKILLVPQHYIIGTRGQVREYVAHLKSGPIVGTVQDFISITVGHINGDPAVIGTSTIGVLLRDGKKWRGNILHTDRPGLLAAIGILHQNIVGPGSG